MNTVRWRRSTAKPSSWFVACRIASAKSSWRYIPLHLWSNCRISNRYRFTLTDPKSFKTIPKIIQKFMFENLWKNHEKSIKFFKNPLKFSNILKNPGKCPIKSEIIRENLEKSNQILKNPKESWKIHKFFRKSPKIFKNQCMKSWKSSRILKNAQESWKMSLNLK